MKKILSVAVTLIAALAVGTSIAFRSGSDLEIFSYKVGQAEKNLSDTSVALQGETISITYGQIDMVIARYKADGKEIDYDHIISTLLRSEALYQLGLQARFTATEAEIDDVAEEYYRVFTEGSNHEQISTFFDGIGMTPREYVDSQREEYRRQIVRGKLAEQIQSGAVYAGEDFSTVDEMAAQYIQIDHIINMTEYSVSTYTTY